MKVNWKRRTDEHGSDNGKGNGSGKLSTSRHVSLKALCMVTFDEVK